MERKVHRLKIGRVYKIEIYPNKNIMSGQYLGKGYHKRIFDSGGSYIFVDSAHIVNRDGILTHTRVSSIPVEIVGKKSSLEANIGLVDELKKIGEL